MPRVSPGGGKEGWAQLELSDVLREIYQILIWVQLNPLRFTQVHMKFVKLVPSKIGISWHLLLPIESGGY